MSYTLYLLKSDDNTYSVGRYSEEIDPKNLHPDKTVVYTRPSFSIRDDAVTIKYLMKEYNVENKGRNIVNLIKRMLRKG